MIRKIVAVMAGCIATSIAVGLIQQLGHYLYPLPSGTDPNDVDAIKRYIENAPFMALFFVIISYAVGALAGGFTSTIIANDGKKIYATVVGTVFLIISVYMMAVIPSPVWFWILGMTAWVLVLAGYLLAKKTASNNH